MGHPFNVAQPHRQHRLGALQRLDLALFVHAQHQRLVGRIEIEPDHVANLFHEKRVSGKLEALAAMRLESEQGIVSEISCLDQYQCCPPDREKEHSREQCCCGGNTAATSLSGHRVRCAWDEHARDRAPTAMARAARPISLTAAVGQAAEVSRLLTFPHRARRKWSELATLRFSAGGAISGNAGASKSEGTPPRYQTV